MAGALIRLGMGSIITLGVLTGLAVPGASASGPLRPSGGHEPVTLVRGHGHLVHIFPTPAAYARVRGETSTGIPADSTTAMSWHGGPVMRAPVNYLIFWQPPGTAFAPGYMATIQRYFEDIGGTPTYNIVTQYTDGTNQPVPDAATYGGTWVDTSAFPHSGEGSDPLLDSDIQGAVSAAISANPGWQPPGLSTMYFVFTGYFTATGDPVDSCTNSSQTSCFAAASNPVGNGYCAYHSYFGTNTIYANMPYASLGDCYTSPNAPAYPNGAAADITLSAVSHEMFEANTDPLLNAWYDNVDGLAGEIGDKCAYNQAPWEPDGTNIVLHGHPYQMQREWSNDPTYFGCVKRYGPAANPSVTASLDFGTVPRGTTAVRDVVISNSGGGDMNVLNVRFGTGTDSRYSFLDVPPTTATIPPGASLTVHVQFSPPASDNSAGPYTGSVVIDADNRDPSTAPDQGNSTWTVPMTGTVGIPQDTLSPGPLNLGLVCRGTTATGTVTATNTGTAPLTLEGATMGGGSSPDMSVSPSPALPQVLAPSDSLGFQVTDSPPANSSGGPETGSFVVSSDDPSSPASVQVNATVGVPVATLDASALHFGGVATDNRTSPDSVSQSLRVSNTGPCDLHLQSVVPSGDFTVTSPVALPATIAAGSSIELTVTFNPSAPGPASGTLVVSTDDPANPTLTVSLDGTGLEPAISASPSQLVFPPTVLTTQVPGYPGTTQSTQVTNTGQAELIVDSLATAAPFSAPGATSPPSRYAVNSGFSEPVTFAPTSRGKFTGSLAITDNGDGEAPVSATVPLCGEGVTRGIRVLVVDGNGTPYPVVSRLKLTSHNTSPGVNINLSSLPLTNVATSCQAGQQMQYQNEALPAAPGGSGGHAAYYTLSVSGGGKAATTSFTLGAAEFKTITVTVK